MAGGQLFSTRSGGMSLARSFKAVVEEIFLFDCASRQQRFSTRSGGMSLARSFKAGIERVFLDLHRVATIEKRQPSLTRRRGLPWRVIPALKGWAKLSRRSATKTYMQKNWTARTAGGQLFSMRSGGMSLARSLKAGIERAFLVLRRVATIEKRQPSLTR
jgi:hypothetical protein